MSPVLKRSLTFLKMLNNENNISLFLKISFDVYLSLHLIISDRHGHFPLNVFPILPSYNVMRYCTTFRMHRSKAFADDIKTSAKYRLMY